MTPKKVSPLPTMMATVLTLSTAGLCVAILYTAIHATRDALDQANDHASIQLNQAMEQVLRVGTNGRLLEPLRDGVERRFEKYHAAAKTVAHLYEIEGVPGWRADEAPGNVTNYLYASLGVHKSLLGEIGFLTVVYHIPYSVQVGQYQGYWNGSLWGSAGCENFGSDTCYFVDETAKFRFFNSPALHPANESYGTAPYSQIRSYTERLEATTKANAQPFWTKPRQEGWGANEQKIEYVLPFEYNSSSSSSAAVAGGNECTAAVSFNLNLTFIDTLLELYRPTPNSYIIFYDSSASGPVNGTFLASSNASQPLWRYRDAVYPALGSQAPHQDIAELLEVVVSKLSPSSSSSSSSSSQRHLNVTGAFPLNGFYYEAVTVAEQFTFVVRAPLSDLYGLEIPSVQLETQDGLWNSWSLGNRAAILCCWCFVIIIAILQGVMTCFYSTKANAANSPSTQQQHSATTPKEPIEFEATAEEDCQKKE